MVMKPIIETIRGANSGEVYLRTWPSVASDLKNTGLAVPELNRIIYNLGEKKVFKTSESGEKVLDRTYKTLTTIVYWATGEKTVVTNAENDGLTFNEDGTVSDYSKEVGLAFAVLKRVLAGRYEYDENGDEYVADSGFGNILAEYIAGAYDCQAEVKKQAAAKAELKKRLADEKANAKSKVKNPSLAESARLLKESADLLREMVSDLAANAK